MKNGDTGTRVNTKSGKISFLWEGQEPSEVEIHRANQESLRRRDNFMCAAKYVAMEFSRIAAVQRVVLFGSVSAPPYKESYFRALNENTGAEVYHSCADIDLAVWIDDMQSIVDLRRARMNALSRLMSEKGIGVAHHQLDVFILNKRDDCYLGRLCIFRKCPAGKYVCGVDGCGTPNYLRIHEGFTFYMSTMESSYPKCLFERPVAI